MIPYVDNSASLKKGAADTGPPLLDMSIDTPVLWESVRLRAIELEQPQSGYAHLAPGYLRDEVNRLSFRPKTDGFTSPVLWRERFSRSPPDRTSQ